jgi:hypothetical protein
MVTEAIITIKKTTNIRTNQIKLFQRVDEFVWKTCFCILVNLFDFKKLVINKTEIFKRLLG